MRKSIKIVSGICVPVATILGIKVFDITIFDGKETKPVIQTQTKTHPPQKHMRTSQTLLVAWASPLLTTKQPLDTRAGLKRAKVISVEALGFSRLMAILEDLPRSSDKFDFIDANTDYMPKRLSWDEMYQILKLFSNYSDRLRVVDTFLSRLPPVLSLTELHRIADMFGNYSDKLRLVSTFLSRLPDALSLADLNQLMSMFGRASDRLEILRIFLLRLEPDYSDGDFQAYRDHFYRISEKKKAINLLLRACLKSPNPSLREAILGENPMTLPLK